MTAIRPALVFAVVLALISSARAELRTWTDATGKFSYEAELVGMEEGMVKLKLPDGRTANIRLDKLSAADQLAVIKALKSEPKGPPPPPVIKDAPKPRKFTETAEHFAELMKRPGAKDKMLGLEGLGKIRIESLDRAEVAEGLELLARIKEFGDHEAWDEASAAIARHHTQNLAWAKAEKAWYEYVSERENTKYLAEAWCSLGFARDKQAGDDKEKLQRALTAYFVCFGKFGGQVRYSSVAWCRAAEINYQLGKHERALQTLQIMFDQIGEIAEVGDPKKLTDDMKWALLELRKAAALYERWSKEEAGE